MTAKQILYLSFFIILSNFSYAQHENHQHTSLPIITDVEPQPLLAQALRLKDALSFLGSSLSKDDMAALTALKGQALNTETTRKIQEILDPYCLAIVSINPESRVKADRGPATARLVQGGWKSFLVKVHNEAGITPALKVESPNAAPALHISSSEPRVKNENVLNHGQVDSRFMEMLIYDKRPLLPNLSGLSLEYQVLQIYCKDAGKREAEIGFNVGQGTQDIGFRNSLHILFDVDPSIKVKLKVKDENGSPSMASFTITDGIERVLPDSIKNLWAKGEWVVDYRLVLSEMNYWVRDKQLAGVYPLPSRRVAAYDEYPDFFFQPQIYRYDGEYVNLPPGTYNIKYTRGPEYITQTETLIVPDGIDSMEAGFKLKRWVDMAALGWYSADHHIHAAGCSHYESPEEGVPPIDMWRQVLGEDLKVGAVLTWGPSWYHQKGYFTGSDDSHSSQSNIMRYDVEVSGFPSSHAGHVVLLHLKEDDYPGTSTIEEWPSWTLPVMKWAKEQGAVVGYAHSGWGLEPINSTKEFPNYVIPKMDGIGANEYIVTVSQNLVDFFSAGDTPAPWELNMWYHTLNCGFKTRLSGETDFPCIFDERVGVARSYFKSGSGLSYEDYMEALKAGRSYVSDGNAHIIDFKVNETEVGTHNSELSLSKPGKLTIKARVTALLPQVQSEAGAEIAGRPLNQQPYWNIERARIGKSNRVAVELIVNGKAVDKTEMTADGKWNNLEFNYSITHSSWIALRIYPSAHTNPVFVLVNNQPIRSKQSAEWCRKAVDQCWKMKEANIRSSEKAEAEAAYNQARSVYDRLISESKD